MTSRLANSAHRIEKNLQGAVTETEQLLEAIGKEGSKQLTGTRARLGHRLEVARHELERLSGTAAKRARAATGATSELAHQHPWAVAGTAAVAGALLAWFLSRR